MNKRHCTKTCKKTSKENKIELVSHSAVCYLGLSKQLGKQSGEVSKSAT